MTTGNGKTPRRWPLVIYKGQTLREHRVWKVGATPETAVPVDLTGCTARMHVRSEVDSPFILLSLTTENGGLALGGASGRIELYMSAQQTAQANWEDGVYDLEIEFPNGDVRRLFYGTVRTDPEATRP